MIGIRSFPFGARPIFGCYVSFWGVLSSKIFRPSPGSRYFGCFEQLRLSLEGWRVATIRFWGGLGIFGVHHKNQPLHGKIGPLKIGRWRLSLGDVSGFNPTFLGLFQVMKRQTRILWLQGVFQRLGEPGAVKNGNQEITCVTIVQVTQEIASIRSTWLS